MKKSVRIIAIFKSYYFAFLFSRILPKSEPKDKKSFKCFSISITLFKIVLPSLFLTIWLIIGNRYFEREFFNYSKTYVVLFKGSVWVFSARYNISYNSIDSNYCNYTCYNFAFGVIITLWCISGIFLFLFCCCFGFLGCLN